MARIKYYDEASGSWKNADNVLFVAPVQSVNGKTGAVVLSAADVGAEGTGAVSTHDADASAHGDIRALIAGAMMKNEYAVKKAQLTLEDGSTVLIDVVVASEGEAVSTYTNQVPLSIDTDGSVYNGTGYMTNYRLSSSGAAKAENYSAVTGFIPAKAGDVVRITGCGWYKALATNYLCAYKSDFTFLGAVTSNLVEYGTQIHSSVDVDGVLATVTLGNVADIAYIRVSAVNDGASDYDVSLTLGADMVVTVNEEIV